ncbi:hypothetical protein ACFLUJ_07890 [Chloroflexota bacterium]
MLLGCNKLDTPKVIPEVTFQQLMSDPNKYNGMNIVIEGFYYQGFETITLCEKLAYSGLAPGHLVPEGEKLWIEKGVPKEIYENAYQQQMLGPLERYGKVKVKGQFEYGEEYGHLGQYKYQIIPIEVGLIMWTPPFARS